MSTAARLPIPSIGFQWLQFLSAGASKNFNFLQKISAIWDLSRAYGRMKGKKGLPKPGALVHHREFSTGLRPTSTDEKYATVLFIITGKIKVFSNSLFLRMSTAACLPILSIGFQKLQFLSAGASKNFNFLQKISAIRDLSRAYRRMKGEKGTSEAGRPCSSSRISTGLRPTSMDERYITVPFIITSKVKVFSNFLFLRLSTAHAVQFLQSASKGFNFFPPGLPKTAISFKKFPRFGTYQGLTGE